MWGVGKIENYVYSALTRSVEMSVVKKCLQILAKINFCYQKNAIKLLV